MIIKSYSLIYIKILCCEKANVREIVYIRFFFYRNSVREVIHIVYS